MMTPGDTDKFANDIMLLGTWLLSFVVVYIVAKLILKKSCNCR